jgi:hypothetical protein
MANYINLPSGISFLKDGTPLHVFYFGTLTSPLINKRTSHTNDVNRLN